MTEATLYFSALGVGSFLPLLPCKGPSCLVTFGPICKETLDGRQALLAEANAQPAHLTRNQLSDSSSKKAVSFSSARTTKRFPSPRCASAIHIVRPSQSRAEIRPQSAENKARRDHFRLETDHRCDEGLSSLAFVEALVELREVLQGERVHFIGFRLLAHADEERSHQ
jgi:hypothetical protein